MLEVTQTRQANPTTAVVRQRRRLYIAIVMLVVAIVAVAVRNHEISSANDNNDQMAATENEQPAVSSTTEATPAPTVSEANPPTAPAVTQPAPRKPSGNAHRPAHRATVKSETASTSQPTSKTWGPATPAAERVQTTSPHAAAPQYPLLTGASAVQGSVLMQALIGADGVVQELRVISGPAILVAAARQAVQQWRFKPYLLNGKPVETQARVTVAFSINVSNTEARYRVDSVSVPGAL